MKKRILCAALAAMMLAGCAAEPQNSESTTAPAPAESTTAAETTAAATAEGTASVSESAAQTTAAAETPADGTMPQFVIVPAPAETFAPVTTAAQTQPAVTTSAKPNYSLRFDLPKDASNLFVYETSADLAGTGYVHAPSGLRLRDKPSTKGKQLSTLKNGSTVEILGVAASLDNEYEYDNEPTSFNQKRWFRVKADGKEGYANADYIAAKFSQSPAELSLRQLRVLTAFMYFQGQTLFMKFARDGGFKGTGQNSSDSFSNDDGLYEQMQPSSLKLSDIYEDFYTYFSKTYNKDILSPSKEGEAKYYIEKDGKLYTNTTFGDIGTWLRFDTAGTILQDGVSDTEIKAQAFWGYQDGYHDETPDYTLVYEDGYWKIGKLAHLY